MLYSEERTNLESAAKRYIFSNFDDLTDTEKFVLIMTSDIPAVIDALGKYVFSCFKEKCP